MVKFAFIYKNMQIGKSDSSSVETVLHIKHITTRNELKSIKRFTVQNLNETRILRQVKNGKIIHLIGFWGKLNGQLIKCLKERIKF